MLENVLQIKQFSFCSASANAYFLLLLIGDQNKMRSSKKQQKTKQNGKSLNFKVYSILPKVGLISNNLNCKNH